MKKVQVMENFLISERYLKYQQYFIFASKVKRASENNEGFSLYYSRET